MVEKSILVVRLIAGQSSRGFCTRLPITNTQVIAKRNALFSEEKKRQAAAVRRVEKIRVKYQGVPEECTLLMNKNISTPFECSRHLPEFIGKGAVLAYVNGNPHDMHSPLKEDCELTFAHFKDSSPDSLKVVNKVFWRSCSFLLGLAIERAFKDEYKVLLHSWPAPSIKSGSFVYDAVLPLQNWTPSGKELLAIGHPVHKMFLNPVDFERLEVEIEVAQKIFEDNPFKHEQVAQFGADNGNKVILYRCADHVDMSRGPMIANTSFVRYFDVASIHPFETPIGLVHRFQGLAYPSQFTISPFSRNVLKERAKEMNMIGLPAESTITLEEANAELKREIDEEENHQPPEAHKAAQ